MISTILVVDDDDDLRSLTAEALSLLGVSVMERADADQAVYALEQYPSIDMVVTDICMPGSMDGVELASLIWVRWPELPVIITSGNRMVPQCLLSPGRTFLRKPWSLEGLFDAVAKHLP